MAAKQLTCMWLRSEGALEGKCIAGFQSHIKIMRILHVGTHVSNANNFKDLLLNPTTKDRCWPSHPFLH